MKILAFTKLRGDARDKFYVCTGLCIIMISPAFLSWSSYRPNVAGEEFGGWYLNYIASPLGIGSGPHRSGWLLIVLTSVVFAALFATLDHPGSRRPILKLVAMTFVLSCYLSLLIGQELQFVRWDHVSSGSNCNGYCQFLSPSGRTLTMGNSSGWGFGVGLLASVFAGAVIDVCIGTLESRLESPPTDN